MSWPPKAAATTRKATLKFATHLPSGALDTEHATCTVRFTTSAQQKTLQNNLPHYQSRITRLRAGHATGLFTRYTRRGGYKLMSSMASFHPDYKLLDDLVLDQEGNEAVCSMDFSDAKTPGEYAAHPAYVDAITQVAGFMMNAKDETDIGKEMWVNHGWGALQIYEELVKGVKYEVYSKMEREKEVAKGEVLVLDGERVVAYFEGLEVSFLLCVWGVGVVVVLTVLAASSCSTQDNVCRAQGGA